MATKGTLCCFAAVPLSACLREGGEKKAQIGVCNGVSCSANGGGIRTLVALQALAPYEDVEVTLTGCLGACKEGSNVVINGGAIVNPSQALQKLGIRPDTRALRGIKLKVHADETDDRNKSIRAYKIALKCMRDNPKGDRVKARIAANLANAYLAAEQYTEALDTAELSLQLDETQGALYAAAAATCALSEDVNQGNQYVAKLNEGKRAALDKWNKDREWGSVWRKAKRNMPFLKKS